MSQIFPQTGVYILTTFFFYSSPPTMMTFFPSLFSVKGKMEDYGPTNASFTNIMSEKDRQDKIKKENYEIP